MNFRQFTSWIAVLNGNKQKKISTMDWEMCTKRTHKPSHTFNKIRWEKKKKTFYTPVNYTKQSWTCNSHMCQWLCHIAVAQSTVTGPSDWTEREKQSTVTTKKKTIDVHSFKLWNEIFYHKTIELRCAHKYSTKRCGKVSTKTSSQIKQEY